MRLIDADKLLDTLGIDSLDCEKCSWGNFDYCKRGSDFVDACAAIENAPTVDAVPVVRCKDCFYSWPFDEEEMKEPYRVGEWHCEFWYGEMHEDDYCSCGKRSKNEAD